LYWAGLGQLVDHLELEVAINYTDIPNFPVSTVGISTQVNCFGTLEGKKTIIMQGLHLYEGYTGNCYLVRVLKALEFLVY
jgi:purine-nucleoside phosphorylase